MELNQKYMSLKNPKWLNQYISKYKEGNQDTLINKINSKYNTKEIEKPSISIVIPAFNEEQTILSCLYSLINQQTKIKYEIIVINNNSTDRTEDLLNMLCIKHFNQNKSGPGPARQLGQEKALGKIIFTADADCYYPPGWIEIFYNVFKDTEVSLVYGKHYFIGTKDVPRWKLMIYELFRNVVTEVRNIKRPFLNAHTLNMAYRKEIGLKIGFDMRDIRGSDGRFAFDFMNYGKIKYIRNKRAGTWTLPRTLYRNKQSLTGAFVMRLLKELKTLPNYFVKLKDHNTKTSSNK